MANPEHAYWFQEGTAAWNQWRKEHPNVVPDLDLIDGHGSILDLADLSGALMRGVDLSNASFKNANFTNANLSHSNLHASDFSGANLSNANLDEAVLCGINLTSANLTEASFVAAKLCRAKLSEAVARRAVFTRATLENALLVETDLSGAILEHANFQDALLRRANFCHAKLAGASLFGAELEGARGDHADLTDADCRKSSIKDCTLTGSILRRTKLTEAVLTGSDFSNAVFDQIQFDGVDLTGVVLFGAKIINPSWRLMPPIATLFGTLRVRDSIPTHPIQDIQGLPHVLRRTIADAQYLIEFEKRTCFSWWQRYLFRLWGITSAFGQSFTRWMCWSLLVLIVFAATFTQIEFASPQYQDKILGKENQGSQGLAPIDPRRASDQRVVESIILIRRLSFIKALYVSTIIFTTLGFSDMTPVSDLGRVLVALEVTIGYMMLGALLAILANKLSRLS